MSSNIYGGDEVNALVLDLGTHSCKAGYAGDDTPKAVFPSVVGIHSDAGSNGMEVDGTSARRLSVGFQALSAKQLGMEVMSPFGPDDLYGDWDLVEAAYNHALRDRLGVRPEEFALMLAEPTHNSRASRERLIELVFETFQAPAMFVAKSAMLSAFATARQTALVVDTGYRATTAAAVQDGYVLQKTVTRTPLAGQLLNHAAQAVADAKYTPLRPRFSFKRQEVKSGEFQVASLDVAGVTNSFRLYHTEQVASDMKEGVCRASETRFFDAEGVNPVPTVVYELPDGQELYLGPERFRMAELFFQPAAFIGHFPGLALPPDVRSVPEAVVDAVNKCDVDLRKDMYSGAVLTGGTSLIPGLKERLEKELSELSPPAAKVKMVAATNNLERRFSTWIGGSILSSLGSFQQLWMSKKEYAEHGTPLVNRKCP
ncbi:ortholog of actin-related protein 4 [Volvox africanus]|uniref:Ortholog of actin-related protein 4 n=1 Tax=Volvox africanus TaxID=51714 RepID=A0ABQ5RZC6_9CHLO|nr:ortholog of actin-related protein 4 [Volvox africanus]